MKQLVGYCGLDCAQCDARTATINNDDELRAKTAKLWCELNNTDEIKPEHINCLGCRTDGLKTYFCSCIGAHVGNTSEIGEFRIISHDFADGVWRVRWKVSAK